MDAHHRHWSLRALTAALALLVIGATGCPGTVDPNEPRDRGVGEASPADAGPDVNADGPAADGPAPDGPLVDLGVDQQQPDQAPTPDGPTQQYCATKVDPNTLSLLTFEVEDAGGFFTDSSSNAFNAWLRGGAKQGASGKAGCNMAAVFDGSANSYLEIDHAAAFSLSSGSIDLWVRFDTAGRMGVLSKDANGTNQNGHITVFRACDGSIVLRKQEPGNTSHVQCSAPVKTGSWVYVGVNFGPGGLELYVDGQRAQRTDKLPCGSAYQCGATTTSGIDGNTNPWVVGATAMTSADGAATPIDNPLQGAIDSLRISKVRRTF
jgi:hypothetical protein